MAQRFSAAIRDLFSVAASAAEAPLGLKPISSASLFAGLEGLRHPKSGATSSSSAAAFWGKRRGWRPRPVKADLVTLDIVILQPL
ncbi:exported hypothetical protein [Candidatus Sulfotelmatobacter kueseliae]|uniref:Uncharacterized protein n=1 Tax=Candidatus Sulfotelmatobacter kueseliae TaxID=2042962 RepID=A0A2U3L4F2_9BACT|nr:exported hypothetical protein [Candidatus Sulfotelmatobacter kueseliae]